MPGLRQARGQGLAMVRLVWRRDDGRDEAQEQQ